MAAAIGRAFARVIAELEGRPASELRLGLGRDMRLTAPELAAAYRDGMCAEGATVLDAGQVATEMLYYLVGSRDLDGGLMCTASHNPKQYTGAKLVSRGAIALSGAAGIDRIRAELEDGLGPAPGGGDIEEVDDRGRVSPGRAALHRPSAVRPLRVVVDGGNGMAGPMVGPAAGPARTRAGRDLLGARRQLPRSRAQPAPAREPPSSSWQAVVEQGADLGIAWDGDADRCFFIDDTGAFVDGDFLTALLAESMLAKEPGGDDPVRRPGQPGRGRHRASGPAARR